MKKFSVVIPTIWKGPWISELLNRFCNTDVVDDIILIDNDFKNALSINEHEKIRRIIPNENLFVNPSWNLGVSLAKNENIIISNDDILFDVNLYLHGLNKLNFLLETHIIGVNTDNYNIIENEMLSVNSHSHHRITEPIKYKAGGWGCLIAVNKKRWVNIPEQLKIWCGDNFLQIACGPHLDFRGIKIDTVMSSSANTSIEWIKQITENDLREWYKLLGIA